MQNAHSRPWRSLRRRYRRWVQRLDREPPEWLRWLTPWGTSLVLHALLLLLLGVIVYARSGRWSFQETAHPVEFATQLRDDLTSSRASDRSGDPFTRLDAEMPPSLALQPAPESDVINVPRMPPQFRLGDRLQLDPPAPEPSQGRETARGGARGSGGLGSKPENDLVMPFAGRSGAMKAMLIRREGGTVESERAVEAGLDWLARHQNPDGSWSLDPTPRCQGQGCPSRSRIVADHAATGLALLPMLAAGHSHLEKGRYQHSLGRGLRWLVKHQRITGELFTDGGWNAAFYSHAIGSMAVCEAYGLTRDKALRRPAERAIRFIVQSQNKLDGGWRYYLGQPGDTSVFGWQLFALRSASLAGLDVPAATVRRCRQYLDLAATDPSKMTYAYQPGGPVHPVMTAEALLGRQYLGWRRDNPSLLRGAALVMANLGDHPQPNIYYWYYATQMIHNMHGKDWPRWNALVRDSLIRMQTGGDACDRGSWDPETPSWDRWTLKGGRLYLTSLSLLTLEVYYRYLPLYRDRDSQIKGNEPPALAAEVEEPAPAGAAP